MEIKNLFKEYEKVFSGIPHIDSMFCNSGMTNDFAKLDYGFFPLGSGILTENSKKDIAKIDNCKIMVLGNDFGTREYLKNIKNNKEKETSPTIRNLIQNTGLGLNTETTFFTNLFMGLRSEGKMTGKKKLTTEFKKVCFDFLQIQLKLINPRIVICLGTEVGQALSEKNEFLDFSFINNIVKTSSPFFGNRTYILIPHPSYAHINWKKFDTVRKIKSEII